MAVVQISSLALCVLAIGAVAWLLLRASRGPVVRHPSCGNCRYNVTGLPTTVCPECGADLQRVGVLLPGTVRPIGPLAWLIVWTCILPFPALMAARMIISRMPLITVFSQRVYLGNPQSEEFISVLMITPSSGSIPSSPGPNDLKVTLTLNDGSQPDLLVDSANTRSRFTDRAGESVAMDQGWCRETLRTWMEAMGVDTESDAVSFELDEIMKNSPRPAALGTGGFTNRTSVSIYSSMGRGFTQSSSSGNSATIPVPHLAAYAWAASTAAWVIGACVILLLTWRREKPGPDAQAPHRDRLVASVAHRG